MMRLSLHIMLPIVLRLAAHAQQAPPVINPECDTEEELLGNLRWMQEVCAQEGQSFPDALTLVPRTIATQGCARAARRVGGECGGLLESSPWFASRHQALGAAVASAADLPDEVAQDREARNRPDRDGLRGGHRRHPKSEPDGQDRERRDPECCCHAPHRSTFPRLRSHLPLM